MEIVFNNLEELKEYYDEKTNTYVFKENDEYLNVVFNFDLRAGASINAWDIKANNICANNINARNIEALDINAMSIYACNIDANNINVYDIRGFDINANNILYYEVCYACNNLTCNSIEGRRINAKHFVLDGKLTIKGEKEMEENNGKIEKIETKEKEKCECCEAYQSDYSDTVSLMCSPDYKDRFIAEYMQLKIRCEKVKKILADAMTPNCLPLKYNRSTYLLERQLRVMQEYLKILELRAEIKKINL